MVCALGFLGACDERLPSENTLQKAIADAMQPGPGTVVSLDSMIPGDWRTLYLFEAYTPQDYMDRCAGKPVDAGSIGVQDGYVLLVVESRNGRLSSVDLRGGVPFSRAALGRAYARGAASFLVAADSLERRNMLVPRGSPRSCG